MLSEQRRLIILDTLTRRGEVISVVEFSDLFQVSSMTIRRDLEQLEKEGKLRRVHGGAVIMQRDTGKPFISRHESFSQEKRSIGRSAASLVESRDKILLDAGTTTLAMVSELDCLDQLTIITHALPIAQALCTCENITTILLGGMLKRQEQCAVGSLVVQALSRFSVDKFFLSAAGFDLHQGATDPDMMEVEVKQAMIRAAKQVILVADSSKWGTAHLMQIAPWSDIDILVTDNGLPEDSRQELAAMDVEVICSQFDG